MRSGERVGIFPGIHLDESAESELEKENNGYGTKGLFFLGGIKFLFFL